MLKRIKNIAYAVRSAVVSSLSRPSRWLVDMFGGAEAKSGARVSEKTAVQVTAVFACVRLLAQTIASLPLHTYRRLNDGKERAYDHPAYHVLHSLANPECTSYNLRQIMMVNLLLTGDAYAEIVRDNAGALKELWPIPSNRVTKRRNKATGEVFFEVYTPDDGKIRRLYPEQMLHIPWVGMAHLDTFKPIVLAREAIGLSMAAEEFGSRFFSDGANASGIAEYPGRMSDEAYDRFKKTFNEKYVGLSKNQRVMFLEQGLKFTKLTINPNEAQAIETRKFQVIEVARFYNVPPHLIMDLERATFSNVEHQDISFVKYSVRPYLVCWEQEMLRTIFIPSERHKYFSEFSVDGLLRGDYKTRQEGLEIMRRNGVINADEWRALENMNSRPDGRGQSYYVPMNWMPDEPQKQSEPGGGERMEGRQAALERSAKTKYKTAQNYKRLFADAGLRIVKRERSQVTDKGKNSLAKGNALEFDAWLENYYRDASQWMIPILSPVLMSYTEAIEPLASDEAGARALPPDLQKWMTGYLANWARDYSAESLSQIRAVIKKANEDGEDPYEAVAARLEEWEEKRPEKLAAKEVTEAAGVISKYVYKSAGVRRIRWVNTGDNSCAYCQELHGKIVGIEQVFLGKGDRLDSEDGGMAINKPTVTPPLHDHCACMIVPA